MIGPATEETANTGYVVAREKYSLGHVEINISTVNNYKSLDAQAILLEPLYCSSSLISRQTQVWLAKLTLSQKHKSFENQTFPSQIVIKIIARDVKPTLNEREILKKAVSHGNINVLWLMCYKKFTIQGCLNTMHDIIF